MSLFNDSPHYQYNKRTLKYERVEHTWVYHLRRFFGVITLGLVFGVVFFLVFIFAIQSPSEKQLSEENDRIATQYRLLSKQLDEALDVMNEIKERDDNFYRVILEADSIPATLRTGNYDATARYKQWISLHTGRIITETSEKMDVLNRMLYVQSNSFDELVELAKRNEERLMHIPAIQPILNQDLKRTASGYGNRIDPIYHTLRFHAGMDFSAPVGTEIFATANGTIQSIGWKQGYGNCIVIDHGYNYQTVYAHISKFQKGLRRGSKVVRGDIIAFVGNTGKSTGPHLHYEVRLKGHPQAPQNYYYLDLDPEEYDEMVRMAANYAKTFD